MAITWSTHIRYSQHDSGLSSMLWNKSFLRILLRMKSTYALASETLKLKKNYLYKNENHFASVGQRANLCLGKFYRLILLPDKWNTAHNSALCTTGETACRVFRALELQSSCPEFNPLHNSCSW